MASELSLKTPSTGLVTLSPANTATDKTITLPAITGTMVVQDGTNTTAVTNLAYTGTLTGSTGIINIGSGQVYKDASGNVGIGTSSPAARLQVAGNVLTTGAFIAGANVSAPTADASIYRAADNTLAFATGSAEKMRLDSSGNLGLGVTPSAWAAGSKGMEFAAAGNAVWSNGTSLMHVLSNSYFNGTNYIYGATAPAAHYYQFNGTHVWRNAPSGTAGNAISFTQAMTLNASGFLSVGNTNPGSTIDVTSNSSALGLRVRARNIDDYGFLQFTNNAGTTEWSSVYAITNTLVFGTAGNERARISSAGQFFVGGSTPLGGFGNENITEFMYQGVGGYCAINSAGANAPLYISLSSSATGDGLIQFSDTGVGVGSITTNGTSTAYNTTSDYRLKENVAPMTDALAKVAALKPVTYTWKADGSDGQGFIAHELQAVVPDCVTGEKDAVDADGNPKYQGVDTSFLVATLVSAIQELTARLEVLENK